MLPLNMIRHFSPVYYGQLRLISLQQTTVYIQKAIFKALQYSTN